MRLLRNNAIAATNAITMTAVIATYRAVFGASVGGGGCDGEGDRVGDAVGGGGVVGGVVGVTGADGEAAAAPTIRYVMS